MTRGLLVLGLLLAACSRAGSSAPAASSTTPSDAAVPPPPGDAASPPPELRADCERVLAHTWQLIGGDPDSDKLRGAKHEREVAECAEHITPAARDCILAATTADQIKPCEPLGK